MYGGEVGSGKYSVVSVQLGGEKRERGLVPAVRLY